MKLIMEHWRSYLNEKHKLFKKAKQVPYKFDWGLLGEEENTKIVTFDFDDTLKFTDTGTATPMVQAMKELLLSGWDVRIVTSRKKDQLLNPDDQETPFSDAEEEIRMFLIQNDLPENMKVYFTDWQDKLDVLKNIGTSAHFDDDEEQIQSIISSDSGIKALQVNPDTGTLINI